MMYYSVISSHKCIWEPRVAQSVIIAKWGQISDVMKCGSGYSRITKFTISKRLAHMVAPWMRTGVWKLGLLTVLVIERVKVAWLPDSDL